jgi:hypothetical protein
LRRDREQVSPAMAGDVPAIARKFEGGAPGDADIDGVWASVGKGTPTRWIGPSHWGRRSSSSTTLPTLSDRIGDRCRGEQSLAVRMRRVSVNRTSVAELDNATAVDHRDPVGYVPDDGDVMRDEQVGNVEILLQVTEQVEHLSLDRDVQGAHRFVADDQTRGHHQRASDGDPLTLSAREARREPARGLPWETYLLEHRPGALCPLLPRGRNVGTQHLSERLADPSRRVERAVRVLEDHLQLCAKGSPPCRIGVSDVAPVESDVTGRDGGAAEDRAADGRLARAGLADQTERLTYADRQAHPVHGHQRWPATSDWVLNPDAAKREQRLLIRDRHRSISASACRQRVSRAGSGSTSATGSAAHSSVPYVQRG